MARFVYFDLQTSGRKGGQEIIQIGAVGSRNDECDFNKYLIPFNSISPYATDNCHGIYKNHFPNGVILIAHGAFTFDAGILLKDFQLAALSNKSIKKTVVDTVSAFKNHFPGPNSFTFSALMEEFELDSTDSTDGLENAFDLRLLVRNARPEHASFGWYSDFLMSGYKSTSVLL